MQFRCVDGTGDQVVLLTVAPGGSNPVLVDIGTVVRYRDGGIGNHFALVSIRPELNAWVFPTIAVGDSGSAVRVGTGLAAAGDLTHLVVDTRWLPKYIAGTRISRMLSIAGGGWSLVSSPLCV